MCASIVLSAALAVRIPSVSQVVSKLMVSQVDSIPLVNLIVIILTVNQDVTTHFVKHTVRLLCCSQIVSML
jgi:hypothetical protein